MFARKLDLGMESEQALDISLGRSWYQKEAQALTLRYERLPLDRAGTLASLTMCGDAARLIVRRPGQDDSQSLTGLVHDGGPVDCVLIRRPDGGFDLERISRLVSNLRPEEVAVPSRGRKDALPVGHEKKRRKFEGILPHVKPQKAAKMATPPAPIITNKKARARERVRPILGPFFRILATTDSPQDEASRLAPKPKGRPPKGKAWDCAVGTWVSCVESNERTGQH